MPFRWKWVKFSLCTPLLNIARSQPCTSATLQLGERILGTHQGGCVAAGTSVGILEKRTFLANATNRTQTSQRMQQIKFWGYCLQ